MVSLVFQRFVCRTVDSLDTDGLDTEFLLFRHWPRQVYVMWCLFMAVSRIVVIMGGRFFEYTQMINGAWQNLHGSIQFCAFPILAHLHPNEF